MVDRREDIRFQLSLDRKVVIGLSDGSTVPARASDISIGGIGVKCDYPADPGSEFPLRFALTVDGLLREVRVRGRVAFCNYSGADACFRIGLRFLEFEADGGDLVRRYVQQRVASGRGTGYLTV